MPTLSGHDFNLPAGLEGLGELAYNLWWSWTPRAQSLFSRINVSAWTRHRNAIAVLRYADQARWAELTADEDFMVDASRLLDEFGRYMANGSDSWYASSPERALPGPIAYFCAEFGIHESMQFYSGGLGILAGDHCKSASDAALPFVGIGLLYRRGYFRQQIDADGHQEHAQPDLDPSQLPMRRARARDGSPLQVSVEIADRVVHAAVWVAQVGRAPILLLDTDIPANDPSDRPITHILYVRGREMRLCQELILGIGGVRALRALGIEPAVWHLNEGHSAFLLVERAGELVASEPGLAAGEALRRVGRDAVFTIHTPVPAGNEVFGRELVTRALDQWFRSAHMRAGRAARARSRPHRRPERALRHDRLRAPPRRGGECRQPAPRADGHRDLAGPGRPPDHRHHERRPRSHLARPARAPAGAARGRRVARESTCEGLSRSRRSGRSTTRSCGPRTCSRSVRWTGSSKGAWRGSSPATGSRPTRCARWSACSSPTR